MQGTLSQCLIGVCTALLVACSGTSKGPNADAQSGGSPVHNNRTGADSNGPDAAPPTESAPLALLGQQVIRADQMHTAMVEAAGGQVLAEFILDRRVKERLDTAGMTVSDQDIQREREVLLGSLSEDANQAQRLLNQLRRAQGLGDDRFARLLRRNAGMRKLVDEQTQVTPALIQQAYDLRYGPRYQARLIVVPKLTDAGAVVADARSGTAFVDLAIEHSTDASRAQGGLLEPISPADPNYPAGIRKALESLSPGAISDPVQIDNGYAILRLERKIPAQDVELADVRSELERDVRLRVQRMLMDQLARGIIQDAEQSLVILDPALERSWRQRPRER